MLIHILSEVLLYETKKALNRDTAKPRALRTQAWIIGTALVLSALSLAGGWYWR
jgi:hypothetical protein